MRRVIRQRHNPARWLVAPGLAIALTGCGGGGSPAPSPAPPPAVTLPPAPTPTPSPPPVVVSPDFSAVRNRIDQFAVQDVAVVIGDRSGVLFRYQRGAMTTTRPVFIASATKLLLGTTAWLLIEDRALSIDTPVNSQIDFWSRDPADPRSRVNFGQLFAFTSGFNGTAEQPSCIGEATISLRACVRQIHDGGLDSPPDQSFNYGNEHMQIAALAMVQARGRSIDTIMRERLLDRLGVSAETRYTLGAGDNPTYSGGMRSTGEDYGLVLAAILRGDIFGDRTGFLTDRVGQRPVATVPGAISQNRLNWQYGFGFWKECTGASYTVNCDTAPVISSAGAFGFTPWIDFNRGYWAVIVTEEPLNRGFDPAERSIALELALQPLIASALGR
jgi:D-alanyl-D-alanine-carboxypeptidase/D-alanyl-D-alanine-endopeptidase